MNKNKILRISAKILFFVLLIGFSVWLGNLLSLNMEQINSKLRQAPVAYSSLGFVILYVLANFVFFFDIKDLLKPIGAVLFGAYFSTLFIYIAELINAVIFFNLSKILGRKFVEKILKGKFRNFYEKVGGMNFGLIFLLRLLPLIPYRVLDASFGLSKVSFRKYFFAVILASPPRIFWIQFVLASIGGFSIEKMMAYYQKNNLISLFTLIYFAVSIMIAFKIKDKLK